MAANSVNSTILQTNSIENYMATSGRPLSNRNLIINGAMQIAQRNTSVTGITSALNPITADRWQVALDSAGTWTMNVESSAPANTEFRKSANLVCTTADSSLGANDYLQLRQLIEGQNVQGIKKGTSAAESLTVSFWVKSSNTGTYICEFYDLDNSRQISKSYTIDAADTWEKKTITVPPDTTGQLDNDNAASLALNFWLLGGSNLTSGTLNSSAWASNVQANRVVGQLNLANAVGNYWAVTGVQLETGAVATPYEWMDYGVELAKCQRYFAKLGANPSGSSNYQAYGSGHNTSTNQGQNIALVFPQYMRTSPTIAYSGNIGVSASGSFVTISSIAGTYIGINSALIQTSTPSVGSSGDGVVLLSNDSTTAFISLTAEL
jgi:hypothetical protein